MSIISGAQPGKESHVGCLHDHFLDFPTKAPYPANAGQIRLGLHTKLNACAMDDDDDLPAGPDRQRTAEGQTR
jgi:hypothetical protein